MKGVKSIDDKTIQNTGSKTAFKTTTFYNKSYLMFSIDFFLTYLIIELHNFKSSTPTGITGSFSYSDSIDTPEE